MTQQQLTYVRQFVHYQASIIFHKVRKNPLLLYKKFMYDYTIPVDLIPYTATISQAIILQTKIFLKNIARDQ